ncbi:hypothetical protein A2482_01325 [Candidatus Falkowbacteria bacterium RIFOXYC2_FULL_48_21]|uniref:Solute-binding protein family 5 domain-containing protein n=1 Tax=Candidatus Falkowbacteria bacterium RIFOXYC2_FULL_48_21 TaxID=1798005 RepID=A0A1F5TH97_9BACT|nr:MAG: hypothetical protein A2482_01325 [Candidatus Falkowbacteria bacterium RIFOXYC2_FULL_48_21]
MPLLKKISASLKNFFLIFRFWRKKKAHRRLVQDFRFHDERLVQKVIGAKASLSLHKLGFVGKYLSPAENTIVRVFCGVIIICATALLLNIYLQNSHLVPQDGGVYTEGLIGSPRYINPLFAPGNDVDLDISGLIFSGFFKIGANGLEKDLAESYEISPDQLTYTIKLRENILWHDGEKLTADDVMFTFARIADSARITRLYYTFNGVVTEKIDDRTVRFRLPQPFAPFLENLALGILPEHIWKNVSTADMLLAEYNLKPIGSGPYKFKSLVKNKFGKVKTFNIERNEAYFVAIPHIEEISFKFHDSFEQAVEALNNKKVDGISYLPKEIRARIINNRNLNFHLLQVPQYTAVFFNIDKNPVLKDVAIRKILSHAVNKEKIVNEVLNAEAQIIDSCILPGSLGYNPETVKYPYNIAHAKTELDKAGWTLDNYEVTKKEEPTKPTDANPEVKETASPSSQSPEPATEAYAYPVRKFKTRYLEFNLTTVNQPETVKVAGELQKDWQQIGVKVNIVVIAPEKVQDVIKNRDYDALLIGQILGLDPDPYPFWHSSQRTYPGLNLTSFSNPDMDKLLEDARRISDEKQRAEKYQKFDKLLSESVPAIFLFNPTYTYPQSKKIKGFNIAKIITPANRLAQVSDWYIKTDRNWGK